MISLDFNFNILTRDLSHYLENQVKVGLFGSGVGLSLVLGFSAAYTCYYLISVAKVSQRSFLGGLLGAMIASVLRYKLLKIKK